MRLTALLCGVAALLPSGDTLTPRAVLENAATALFPATPLSLSPLGCFVGDEGKDDPVDFPYSPYIDYSFFKWFSVLDSCDPAAGWARHDAISYIYNVSSAQDCAAKLEFLNCCLCEAPLFPGACLDKAAWSPTFEAQAGNVSAPADLWAVPGPFRITLVTSPSSPELDCLAIPIPVLANASSVQTPPDTCAPSQNQSACPLAAVYNITADNPQVELSLWNVRLDPLPPLEHALMAVDTALLAALVASFAPIWVPLLGMYELFEAALPTIEAAARPFYIIGSILYFALTFFPSILLIMKKCRAGAPGALIAWRRVWMLELRAR